MRGSRELRGENESLRQECGNLSQRLSACQSAGRRVTREKEVVVRELETAKAQAVATTRMCDRLLDQVATLTKDLTRSPEVLSEAILTGIGTILNGYAVQAAESRDASVEATSMGSLGLDDRGGVPAGHFFPDVEFDEFMEGRQSWPTPGMMTTSSPVTPAEGSTPSHAITPDGRVARMDGQPMFQTGMSGPPPVGGVE